MPKTNQKVLEMKLDQVIAAILTKNCEDKENINSLTKSQAALQEAILGLTATLQQMQQMNETLRFTQNPPITHKEPEP